MTERRITANLNQGGRYANQTAGSISAEIIFGSRFSVPLSNTQLNITLPYEFVSASPDPDHLEPTLYWKTTPSQVIITSSSDITAPEADAGNDQTVIVNTVVNLDGSGSTDNIGIVSYEWDFGDGDTSTGMTTSHTYNETGTYTITLTVKDAAGNSNEDSLKIIVQTEFPWTTIGIIGAIAAVAAVIVLYFIVIKKQPLHLSSVTSLTKNLLREFERRSTQAVNMMKTIFQKLQKQLKKMLRP
jgi:hypothetical protein